LRDLDPDQFAPDEFATGPRVIYHWLPKGSQASKLPAALTDKKLGVTVTVRNWRTVTKLAALAAGEPVPFTGSHPAAVLPLVHAGLVPSALVIGSHDPGSSVLHPAARRRACDAHHPRRRDGRRGVRPRRLLPVAGTAGAGEPIPRHAFEPAPRVDAAILVIRRR
jgi:Domain of unknown function (DUF4184)